MQIVHRPGGKHSNADGLSRLPETIPFCDCYQAGRNLKDLPCGGCAYCTKAHSQWERFCTDIDDVQPLAIRAISPATETPPDPVPSPSGTTAKISASPAPEFPPPIPSVQEEANAIRSNWLPSYSPKELRESQRSDPDLAIVIQWLEGDELPLADVLFLSSPATKVLWIHRLQLRLYGGILYYTWEDKPDRRISLVVPASLRKLVLTSCHDDKTAGHLGQNKTVLRVKQSFWWPHMTVTPMSKAVRLVVATNPPPTPASST